MRNIKGVVISDEVEEAIYDATDLYGVYEFNLDTSAGNVIYVLGMASSCLDKMIEAQNYLNKRCPEFIWVAALYNWDYPVGTMLFTSSLWYDEGM